MIELQNVSKSFPGARALTDVSVAFRSGRVHALVGENRGLALGAACGAGGGVSSGSGSRAGKTIGLSLNGVVYYTNFVAEGVAMGLDGDEVPAVRSEARAVTSRTHRGRAPRPSGVHLPDGTTQERGRR